MEELFKSLAKMSPVTKPNFDGLQIPVLIGPNIDFVRNPIGPMNEIDHEVFDLSLERITCENCFSEELPYDRIREVHERILHEVNRNIQLFKDNGIPVFFDGKSPIQHNGFRDTSIFLEYQIPEELMYKSFFVTETFEKAVDRAYHYARSKVHSFIDNY